jgi:hypothetical protein
MQVLPPASPRRRHSRTSISTAHTHAYSPQSRLLAAREWSLVDDTDAPAIRAHAVRRKQLLLLYVHVPYTANHQEFTFFQSDYHSNRANTETKRFVSMFYYSLSIL